MIQNEPGDETKPTNGPTRFSFSDAETRADALKRWPDGLAEVNGHNITGSWTRLVQYLQQNPDAQLRLVSALGDRVLKRIVTGGALAAYVEVAANTIKSIDRGATKPRPDVLDQYKRKLAELWQYAKAGPSPNQHRSHWTQSCIAVGPGQLIAEMVNAIVSASEEAAPSTASIAARGNGQAALSRFPLRVAAFQLGTTLTMLDAIHRDTNHLPQHLIETLYIRWMSVPTVRRLMEPPALFSATELKSFADNLEKICVKYSPHTLDPGKAHSRLSMDVVLLEPWPLLPPFIGMVYDAVNADSMQLSPLLWSAAAVTEEGTLGCEIPGAYLIPSDRRRYAEYRAMLVTGHGPPVKQFLQGLRELLPHSRQG